MKISGSILSPRSTEIPSLSQGNSHPALLPKDKLQASRATSEDGFIMSTLKAIGRFFQWLFCCGSKESRNDNDKKDKGSTPKASPKLKSDTHNDNQARILSEVKKNPMALYSHLEFLDDRGFKLKIVTEVPRTLEVLNNTKYSPDDELLLEAAEKNPQVLKHIKSEEQTKRLLSSSIKEHPEWLAVVNLTLSKEFKLEAITQNPQAAQYMRFEDKFLLEILENHFDAFQYIRSESLDKENFMLKAIEIDPRALQYSDHLKSNKLFLCRLLYKVNFNLEACNGNLPYNSEEDIFIAAVQAKDDYFIFTYKSYYGNLLTFEFLSKIESDYPEQLKSMSCLRETYEELRNRPLE